MEMPSEKAREEITRFIKTKSSPEIEQNCAACSYCDVICPTASKPSEMRKEILGEKSCQTGALGLQLFAEDIPDNFINLGLEYDKAEKEKLLKSIADGLKDLNPNFLNNIITGT